MITIPSLYIATKKAKQSDVKRSKISAIAFTPRGHIITTASNQTIKGHKDKFTIHAEENIIKKLEKLNAFKRFKSIILLVVRVNSEGLSMAKPCCRCMKLLKRYPIQIMYSDYKGEIVQMTLKRKICH